MAATVGGLFLIVYAGGIIAITIYVLRLLGQFVHAQERLAGAAEAIARKLEPGSGRPGR